VWDLSTSLGANARELIPKTRTGKLVFEIWFTKPLTESITIIALGATDCVLSVVGGDSGSPIKASVNYDTAQF